MLGIFKKKDVQWAEALGVLGLGMRATKEEIRHAYLAKMRLFHPDLGGDQHSAAQINWARDVLMHT